MTSYYSTSDFFYPKYMKLPSETQDIEGFQYYIVGLTFITRRLVIHIIK